MCAEKSSKAVKMEICEIQACLYNKYRSLQIAIIQQNGKW